LVHKLLSVIILTFTALGNSYAAQYWGAMITNAVQQNTKVKKSAEYKFMVQSFSLQPRV